MTQNLVSYWKSVEDARANRAREEETQRYNTLYINELSRHNRAQEGIQSQQNAINLMQVQELTRSNLAREQETYRSNVAREDETNRANVAKEKETHRTNAVHEGLQHWKDASDIAISNNRFELDKAKAESFGLIDSVSSAMGTIFKGASTLSTIFG